MKKYLLALITLLTLLLVGCESGLKIKEQITTNFTSDDKALFGGEYLTYLKGMAAEYGYTVDEPILTDVRMEVTVRDKSSLDTGTFTLTIENGEYVWNQLWKNEDGSTESDEPETYSDLKTWCFYVTHDLDKVWIENQSYDIIFIKDGTDHMSGYLFNKSNLTYDESEKLVSLDLWPGTKVWKTEIVKNFSGEVVQVSEINEEGNQTSSRSKISNYYVDGKTVGAIGVSYPDNVYKVFVPSTITSDLSISGATLVREYYSNPLSRIYTSTNYNMNGEKIGESTSDGNGNSTWKNYNNGELVYESTNNSNGNSTWKNYSSGVLTGRGYSENGVSYNYYVTTSPVFYNLIDTPPTENVLCENISYNSTNTSTTKYYYNANLTTLEKDSGVCIYECNSSGFSQNYTVDGVPVPTDRSIKSISKSKQVNTIVNTNVNINTSVINNIEKIQNILTQNHKRFW